MAFRIDDTLNEARVRDMQTALERAFAGNKAALGRRLGYKDGSFVGQMLRRERPITEVTHAALLGLREVKALRDSMGESPIAHPVSYQPDTIPSLSWEELMQTKDLPDAFWVPLGDDALAPKLPKGTVVRFTRGITPEWGNIVLLRDARGAMHVRVHKQDAERKWRAVATSEAFMAFTDATPGVERVAVLTAVETRMPDVL